jgi:hypothetical protein
MRCGTQRTIPNSPVAVKNRGVAAAARSNESRHWLRLTTTACGEGPRPNAACYAAGMDQPRPAGVRLSLDLTDASAVPYFM